VPHRRATGQIGKGKWQNGRKFYGKKKEIMGSVEAALCKVPAKNLRANMGIDLREGRQKEGIRVE